MGVLDPLRITLISACPSPATLALSCTAAPCFAFHRLLQPSSIHGGLDPSCHVSCCISDSLSFLRFRHQQGACTTPSSHSRPPLSGQTQRERLLRIYFIHSGPTICSPSLSSVVRLLPRCLTQPPQLWTGVHARLCHPCIFLSPRSVDSHSS
ncbi:hypothetical protein BD414DRAFT_188817 [Trametes punicea]|nr:hypothetical protein BD414DRAFT_188817 [Trametes punicea]